MALFLKILLTEFIAEMGDKTQLIAGCSDIPL